MRTGGAREDGREWRRRRLVEQMRAIENRTGGERSEAVTIATGWGNADAVLGGGLRRGAIHEWFAPDSRQSTSGTENFPVIEPRRGRAVRQAGGFWSAPLCLLTHLAWQALAARPGGVVLWVGRRCRPHPRILCRDRGRDRRLLMASLFVDTSASPAGEPSARAARVTRARRTSGLGARPSNLSLWSLDLALRNPAVAAVIADGGGLDMAATRRLQLAAEAGGAIALLARPAHELDRLSAADTRWRVRHRVSDQPAWTLELLRSKTAITPGDHRAWNVQWDAKAGLVVVSADVVDRSAATPTPSPVAGQHRRTA